MNKNKKKIFMWVGSAILFFLVGTLIFPIFNYKKESSNTFKQEKIIQEEFSDHFVLGQGETTYTIWLFTDPQLQQAGGIYSKSYLVDAISDINTICDVDIAFCIGDEIQGYDGDDEDECVWDWDNFHDAWDDLNVNIYKNYTIGNHETMPPTVDGEGYYDGMTWKWNGILYPSRPDVNCSINASITPYGNYTYTFGNILFIILGCEKEKASPNYYGWYGNQTEWFNQTVEANSNKNIIVLNHYPMRDTNYYKNENIIQPVHDYYFRNVIENESNNVVAYFHGHWHDPQSTQDMVENISWNDPYSCVFSNAGCINHYGGSDSESQIINITEGSKTVTLRVYDHTNNEWENINGGFPPDTYEFTFDLLYEFSLTTMPQIIEINGGTNGTTVYDTTPTFVWSNVTNYIQYHLQIANDSGFSDLVVNLSDINEENYPDEFTASGDSITFILPDENELLFYRTYYVRVKGRYI